MKNDGKWHPPCLAGSQPPPLHTSLSRSTASSPQHPSLMIVEGFSFSGGLFGYYPPNPSSLWKGNGEYFQDLMVCSVWTDGYKLRVKDVQKEVLPGVCDISNSAFPSVFLARFPFPWLQEKLEQEKGAQTCQGVVELSCGLGRELGGAVK